MKILWAVDIYDEHPKSVDSVFQFLTSLSVHFSLNVDALYIASVPPPNLAEEDENTIQEKLHKQMNAKISRAKTAPWFGDCHIVMNKSLPQRTSVKKLTEFSRINGYDALLVVKHSKKTKKTKFLGTFAEMSVFLSTVPVFLINPDGVQSEKISELLIAVDDSVKKERDFKNLLRFFSTFGLSMKLLHVIPIPFYFLFTDSIRDYVSDEDRYSEKNFFPMLNMARQTGWSAELILKHTRKSIESAVLSEARKTKADLITLIHKHEDETGYLVGRLTRKIIQQTDRPLLLFRP